MILERFDCDGIIAADCPPPLAAAFDEAFTDGSPLLFTLAGATGPGDPNELLSDEPTTVGEKANGNSSPSSSLPAAPAVLPGTVRSSSRGGQRVAAATGDNRRKSRDGKKTSEIPPPENEGLGTNTTRANAAAEAVVSHTPRAPKHPAPASSRKVRGSNRAAGEVRKSMMTKVEIERGVPQAVAAIKPDYAGAEHWFESARDQHPGGERRGKKGAGSRGISALDRAHGQQQLPRFQSSLAQDFLDLFARQ